MRKRFASHQHPFAAAFDEFVEEETDVRHDEAADVESEELGGMSRTQLQADLGLVSVAKAWILDLAGDLVCTLVRTRDIGM